MLNQISYKKQVNMRQRAGFKSQKTAADAIGCERGTVGMWEAPSSTVSAVGEEYLLSVACAYKVRPGYINSGTGEDDFPWSDAGVVAPAETQPGYVRYQRFEGGAGPGVINPDYPDVFREVEISEWQLRDELGRVPPPSRVKLVTVRGISMAPRIRNGDVVFVDVEDREPFDGGLFAIVLHGHTLVKRLEIRTDGLHIVSLASPDRPDVVPPNEMSDLHIAGRIIGAIQLRKPEDL